MRGRPPFGPAELSLELGAPAAELVAAVRLGRELEAFALAATVEVGRDFGARVMAALAAEPAPQPVAAVGRALATGRPLAVLAGLRDAWRVALGGGRPTLVRAQALALVLLALLAFGAAGSLAGAAVLRTLDLRQAPAPVVPVAPPSPVVTSTPTATPTPTPSARAEATGTIKPTESASAAPAFGPTPPVTPTHSARPTHEPAETPEASETPNPSDVGSGLDTPEPSDTLAPGG
ncbi:MAG: hypothetical protein M3067_13450 [Chloroflexota bacterium]|nr:hypothetical protein [Chloroflexota bacterium]